MNCLTIFESYNTQILTYLWYEYPHPNTTIRLNFATYRVPERALAPFKLKVRSFT